MAKPWHQIQKDKGVKLVVRWYVPRNCWKKYHDGNVWYFHHPDSAEGYEAAVLEYHSRLDALKEKRPLAPEFQHHIHVLQKSADWYDRFGVPADEDLVRNEVGTALEFLKANFDSKEALPRVETCLPEGTTNAECQFIKLFCEQGIISSNDSSSAFNRQFGSIGWVPSTVWEERFCQLDSLSSLRFRRQVTFAQRHGLKV